MISAECWGNETCRFLGNSEQWLPNSAVTNSGYRHVTNRLPTGHRLSADCWPTVSQHFGLKHKANCWRSVGQLLANSRLTVYFGNFSSLLPIFCVSRGFIKGQAPGKLTSCEQELAINLPSCFRLLFFLSFKRKTKNARLKNPTDLLHKNLMNCVSIV